MPLLIRAEDVNGLLTIEEAIDAVEAGFREWGKSPELNAPRKRIMTPEGVRVSVHPGGIPSLGAIGILAHSEHVAVSKEVQTYHNMGGPVTVLFDVKDASLMAILVGRVALKELPAERPTPIRTAATSAVGTRYLARPDSKVLGILGAGGEAKYHLLALSKTRPFEMAKVYCRTRSTREQFCRLMEKLVRCEVIPVSGAQEAVEGADVLLHRDQLQCSGFQWRMASNRRACNLHHGWKCWSGARRSCGHATPGARRHHDQRSDVIVVNSREQAIQDEQADLFEPVQAGFLGWEKVGELGQLLNGSIAGRTGATQITLFKNNAGQGVADVAVASKIYSLARRNGIGMEF